MRNFILNQTHITQLINSSIISTWIDEFSQVLAVYDSTSRLHLFSFTNLFSHLTPIYSVDIQPPTSNIIYFIFKKEEDTFYLFLENASVLKVNNKGDKEQIDLNELGTENLKLICAEVSPNLEYIVAVFSDYRMLLLNYDLEVVNSCEVDDGDMTDITKDDGLCGEAAVSWRQDSQYFAVIYTINGGRKTLVRDTKLNVAKGPARADDKVIFSIAEQPLNNLSNVIAWQSSLIAQYQEFSFTTNINDFSKKAAILFSEKNCLRHGEHYTEMKGKCRFLKWNIDLPLLAAYIEEDIEGQSDTKNTIALFYRSNYEWSNRFSFKTLDKVVSMRFSDTLPLRLFIVYQNGQFQTIDFKLEYQSSLSNNNNDKDDNGIIAVLKNNQIHFTPLGLVNIPPPMSFRSVELTSTTTTNNSNPTHLLHWWKDYLFVLSNKGVLRLFRNYQMIQEMKIKEIEENFVKFFIFNDHGYLIVVSELANDKDNDELHIFKMDFDKHVDNNEMKFADYSMHQQMKILRCYSLFNQLSNKVAANEDELVKSGLMTDIKPTTAEDDLMFGLANNNNNNINNINLNTNNNNPHAYIYMFNKDPKEPNNLILNKLHIEEDGTTDIHEQSITLNQTDIIKAQTLTFNNSEEIIYLTRNNRLFIGSHLISLDVSSFEIYRQFLIFTQTTNTPYNILHLINLNEKKDLNTLIQNNSKFNQRSIERNALIVTVSKTKVVLQMPRGNLETITPRILVLNEIIDLVKEHRYLNAFELIRKNKINPNFLYDVDNEGFLKNIKEIVTQIKKVDYLNLFVNSIENSYSEEILTLFQDLTNQEDLKKLYINNKIEKICDAIKKVIFELGLEKEYITTVLHAHCKKNEYYEALVLVQKMKENQKALEYLCWIVNTNVLFDFALKTYDFELVIMVAKHSQKDPKEYLPYLRKLQEMDPILMKYQINMDLKYYEDALVEISKGQEKYFELSLELVDKYKLYETAFKLFSENEQLFRTIYKHYAIYLETSQKYYEAGYAFMRSGSTNYNDAIRCFIKSGAFTEFTLIYQKLEDKSEFEQNLTELIDVARLLKKTNELENILHFTKINPNFTIEEKLMEALLFTKNWKYAYLLSLETNYPKVMNDFKDGIKLAANLKMNEFTKRIDTYEEKYTRLLKVQHEKRLMPNLGQDLEMFKKDEDTFSETASVVSNQSGKSGKSSRSKRSQTSKISQKTRNKMKSRKIKEGSPLEEEYLIMLLSELKIEQSEKDETGALISLMNIVKMNDAARELKRVFEKAVMLTDKAAYRTVLQQDFINKHPEIKDIFPAMFEVDGESNLKKKLIEKN